MSDEIREQIHAELCKVLDEREEAQRRPSWRGLLNPASLLQGALAVIAGIVSATAAVTMVVSGLTNDVETNTKNHQQVVEMVGQERTERVAADHRLGSRIDVERETRIQQVRESEARIVRQLDELKEGQREMNRDIKIIIRALPRNGGTE